MRDHCRWLGGRLAQSDRRCRSSNDCEIGIDQNLARSQVEMVAGGRTHYNLRSEGRSLEAAAVSEVVKQVKMVAGTVDLLFLLFQVAS